MALNYHMETLNKGDIQEGGKIVIPKYQRGIVWKLNHKKEFISSVKTGDPIGVVLVYKENNNYTLIDGLQRLSTIKAYLANPLVFIDEKDKFFNEELIENLIKEKRRSLGLNPPNDSLMLKEKRQFKKKLLSLMNDKNMPRGYEIYRYFVNDLGFPDTTEAMGSFMKFYEDFQKTLELDDDVKIQAIVYDGPKENLPAVFHNLNTGSVSLTKYEVFASIWPKAPLKFADEEIIEKVISKYENLKNSSNFDVEVTPEEIRNSGITLFEYCYAISEILNSDSRFSYLFDNGNEKKTTDPIGFDLLALACGLPVNKAQSLCEDGYLKGCTVPFLVDLKNALTDSVSIVAKTIKNWIFDYRGKNIRSDSQYQLYHMIMAVLKNKYDIDFPNNTVSEKTDSYSKEWIKKFQKYANTHYLNDIVSDYWSINRQVSDLKREIENPESLSRYTFAISKNELIDNLRKYLENSYPKSTGKTVDATAKLLLNYYYKLKERKLGNTVFSEIYGRNENTVFDIEHIVPLDKFESFPSEEFSKSFIGNLCYLSVKDNRSKKDKTLYEFIKDRPAFSPDSDFKKYVDYPDEDEMQFIDCNKEEFKNGFEALVKTRAERLMSDLAEMLTNN